MYVNQNQTRVIETEILSFWTTESNAEKFSAAVKFANEKTLGVRTLFPTVALPIPVTAGTIEYIKESIMKIWTLIQSTLFIADIVGTSS